MLRQIQQTQLNKHLKHFEMNKFKETKIQKSIRKFKESEKKRKDLEEFRRVQSNNNIIKHFKTEKKFNEEKVKAIIILKDTIQKSKWMIKQLKKMKWQE